MIVHQFFGQEPNWPSCSDLILWLIECNPPHTESCLSRKDETYRGDVDHHIQEFVTNKKLEVRMVNTEVNIADNLMKFAPRALLLRSKETNGTTTSWRKRENQIRGCRKRVEGRKGQKAEKGTESKRTERTKVDWRIEGVDWVDSTTLNSGTNS